MDEVMPLPSNSNPILLRIFIASLPARAIAVLGGQVPDDVQSMIR